jgi:hypothetical protein
VSASAIDHLIDSNWGKGRGHSFAFSLKPKRSPGDGGRHRGFGFRLGGTCDGEGKTHHDGECTTLLCLPGNADGLLTLRRVVAPVLPRLDRYLAADFRAKT